MVPKLTINAIDRTSILIEDSWVIDDNDGDIMDTIELELDDQSANITITEGQDIIFEDAADSTVRYFAGIISEVVEDSLGVGRLIKITAVDWKTILDRAYFTAEFINKNDSVIIADAFTEAAITEINTADLVQTGRQIDHIIFRGASLRLLMDTLTQITGFYWDVDKFKKLIYRPFGDKVASFNFTDGATSSILIPYYNFLRRRDIGQFNRVIIVGAKKLITVTNQTYSGDGVKKRFTLSVDNTDSSKDYPLIFRGPEGADPDIPTIDKNTGTDGSPTWTSQTVGIEEQDAGKDVLWNPAAAVHQVIFTTAPPNFANNSWRISGRAFVPASADESDEVAVAAAGRTFTKILILPEVEDDDQAQDAAEAFLKEQGPKQLVQLTFTDDGLLVGDQIKVTNSIHGLTAKEFQTHSISMRGLGASVYEYTAVLRVAP